MTEQKSAPVCDIFRRLSEGKSVTSFRSRSRDFELNWAPVFGGVAVTSLTNRGVDKSLNSGPWSVTSFAIGIRK